MTMLTNRRYFLRGAAGRTLAKDAVAGGPPLLAPGQAAAQSGAAGGVPDMRLLAHPTIAAEPEGDAFRREVRAAFPLPENYVHRNTGTTGSRTTFAQDNLAVYNHYKLADPRDCRKNLAADVPDFFPVDDGGSASIENRHAAVAAMYGANDDEIVHPTARPTAAT